MNTHRDTSDAPDHISNKGKVVLGYMKDGSDSEHLDLGMRIFLFAPIPLILIIFIDHPLAENFDLRAGHVKFEVPKVDEAADYIIVCKSPPFPLPHVKQRLTIRFYE